MNGFVLLISFLLIRFGLLSFLNRDTVERAAFFAPVIGREVPAYWLYQISNVFIFVYVCFQKIVIDSSWVCYGGSHQLCIRIDTVYSFYRKFCCAADLVGKDPEELYLRDCLRKGFQEDRCQIYVFRCAVYYAEHREHDPEKLKWWYWKDKEYPERGERWICLTGYRN